MLGCSRQHVVDLCDRGELPSTRSGTHRRIPLAALRSTPASLTPDQRRSLWYHLAVSARLVAEPDRIIRDAQERIGVWLAKDSRRRSHPWLNEWRAVLEQGPDAVLEAMTSTDQHACDLRQSTPFAGILSEGERRRLIEASMNVAR